MLHNKHGIELRGEGRGGVRDPSSRVLSRASLTSALEAELARILELRERGLGVTEIAKIVYRDKRRRYRVWRLLKKVERGELPDPRASSLYGGNVAWGGGSHVAGSDTLQHEPEDGPGGPKAEPQLPGYGRLGRLGRTQRLVLDALATPHYPVAPSVVASYIQARQGSARGARQGPQEAWLARDQDLPQRGAGPQDRTPILEPTTPRGTRRPQAWTELAREATILTLHLARQALNR